MRQIDAKFLAIAAQLMPDGSDNLNGLLTALIRDVPAEEVGPRQSDGRTSPSEGKAVGRTQSTF